MPTQSLTQVPETLAPTLTVLSLGAGVQSTALAIMADRGDHDMPPVDHAIFADTGWEPQAVYEHLSWLREELSYPVHVVRSGDLKADLILGQNATGQSFFSVPVYVPNKQGKMAIGRRQCTKEYKVRPVVRKIRDILGIKPKKRIPRGTVVEEWLGISTDEVQRVRSSIDGNPPWIQIRYPLIDANLSRQDCLDYFNDLYPGRELRKSACIGCPYHSQADWYRMFHEEPDDYADTARVERAMNETPTAEKFGRRVMLTRSGWLDEIDWANMPKQSEFLG